jgi:hypothetical protein
MPPSWGPPVAAEAKTPSSWGHRDAAEVAFKVPEKGVAVLPSAPSPFALLPLLSPPSFPMSPWAATRNPLSADASAVSGVLPSGLGPSPLRPRALSQAVSDLLTRGLGPPLKRSRTSSQAVSDLLPSGLGPTPKRSQTYSQAVSDLLQRGLGPSPQRSCSNPNASQLGSPSCC